MKKLFKPASLLFNLLTLLTFFFVGISFAKLIEAGKGQMLAAGATVLGYGVLFATITFIISFFMTYRLKHKLIVKLNIVFAILLIAFIGYFAYQYQLRQKARSSVSQRISVHSIQIRVA